MNAPLHTLPHGLSTLTLADAVARACERIAPVWPLDRYIAVNPHWGWTDRPIEDAAATLGALAGMRLVADATVQRQPLVADLAGWRDAVVHQISQHCAAHVDDGQARWHTPTDAGLYRSWRERLAADRGIAWPQGRKAAQAAIAALPDDPMAAVQHAVERLGLAEDAVEPCLTAWLLDLNGWAAALAWHRWQARLSGGDNAAPLDLLAIRAAWDGLLAAALPADRLRAWAEGWSGIDASVLAHRARQHAAWERLEADERALQARLAATLRAAPEAAPAVPSVQAVFCIDVRSEVFRRALESADASIATRGFAGFFGLPVDYRPAGTAWRQPQLPGLLPASMTVDDTPADRSLGEALAGRRRARLAAGAVWEGWRGTPAATFSYVESCGVLAAGALLRESLPHGADGGGTAAKGWAHAGVAPSEAQALRPQLALGTEPAADLAANVLRAMGLVDGYAPLVLLCGHGGQSANNPHAAGLDCGACGGQTGEVNARALATLLNDTAVRAALARRGITIPDGTHVLAGLHNTTTDDVTLFDTGDAPAALAPQIDALHRALAAAGDAARAERAPGLGLPPMPAPALRARLRERASHWAETRPEWGLAGNAAFIAAPRHRTLGANLGGRVFLHDYDHRLDPEWCVLTLILTAPMVVAHWINLQYLVSTVDPQRHGAGNKLLHNVVGGGVGVFEGNGGDLRIGLPWQSVHDGERLRHEPLRLSVFVEAPTDAIDAVIAAHEPVRRLVDHGWLHLLAIGGEGPPSVARRRRGGGWDAMAAPLP